MRLSRIIFVGQVIGSFGTRRDQIGEAVENEMELILE